MLQASASTSFSYFIPYCFCFFTSFFLPTLLYIRYCLYLVLIQVVSIEGIRGMSLGHLSAKYLAGLLLGAARTFFSFVSVRQMVWPHSNYNKSCLISSHK